MVVELTWRFWRKDPDGPNTLLIGLETYVMPTEMETERSRSPKHPKKMALMKQAGMMHL
jgi:hypothetical protein